MGHNSTMTAPHHNNGLNSLASSSNTLTSSVTAHFQRLHDRAISNDSDSNLVVQRTSDSLRQDERLWSNLETQQPSYPVVNKPPGYNAPTEPMQQSMGSSAEFILPDDMLNYLADQNGASNQPRVNTDNPGPCDNQQEQFRPPPPYHQTHQSNQGQMSGGLMAPTPNQGPQYNVVPPSPVYNNNASNNNNMGFIPPPPPAPPMQSNGGYQVPQQQMFPMRSPHCSVPQPMAMAPPMGQPGPLCSNHTNNRRKPFNNNPTAMQNSSGYNSYGANNQNRTQHYPTEYCSQGQHGYPQYNNGQPMRSGNYCPAPYNSSNGGYYQPSAPQMQQGNMPGQSYNPSNNVSPRRPMAMGQQNNNGYYGANNGNWGPGQFRPESNNNHQVKTQSSPNNNNGGNPPNGMRLEVYQRTLEYVQQCRQHMGSQRMPGEQ